MLKHCSPSSVDIRRRSRRNLLTIVDNADIGSDIVVTDHVYDIEDNKEDDYAIPYDIRVEEDLELNEDDIEFDTTSIRSSYSTNTTSDSSCSSVGNIRSHGHHHHGINLEPNGNRILIQQHGYHNKDNQKDKRNQRYSNKNYSQVKKNSSSSINSCVSTINASHRVILSLSSDDSHISSNNTPNITDKPQGSHIDKKTSSVKTNLSQFYQCKAKDQNNLTLSNLNSSSDTLSDLLENDGSKTDFSTMIDRRVNNNPIEISTSGITKTLITSQPLSSTSSSESSGLVKCDIFPPRKTKQRIGDSPQRLNARVLKLSEKSVQNHVHPSPAYTASPTPLKLEKLAPPTALIKYPEPHQQPVKNMPIKIYSRCLSSDIEYKTLSVNHQTSSKEVIWMLLSKFKMKHRDPKLFYLTMDINIKRTGIPLRRTLSLDDDSRPAELKSCHPWGECRFTLQMRKGGLVRVHASVLMPESKYKCLLISEQTTTREVIEILFHCYGLMDQKKHSIDQFCLYEQCPSQGYERQMHPDDQPVPLQSMWPSSAAENGNPFSFVLKKLSIGDLSSEQTDLMMYSSHHVSKDNRFSSASFNSHRKKPKYNCKDILEEEDAIEQLNNLVEDVIVDEVVTSVDDENNEAIDLLSSNMNAHRHGNNKTKKYPSCDNSTDENVNRNELPRCEGTMNATASANQLDTSYSSSGECSTASSEYSALRFRDSPMSSSSR